MYAQLCSSANRIFTSVVVYSRTTKQNEPINNTVLVDNSGTENMFMEFEIK